MIIKFNSRFFLFEKIRLQKVVISCHTCFKISTLEKVKLSAYSTRRFYSLEYYKFLTATFFFRYVLQKYMTFL